MFDNQVRLASGHLIDEFFAFHLSTGNKKRGSELLCIGGKRRERVSILFLRIAAFSSRKPVSSLKVYTIEFTATRVSLFAVPTKLSQVFMSAHEEPLFVAMRVLLVLSAVVENGYDWQQAPR